MYQVPEEYYFRLHHPRPRFKNDVENVLIYLAHEICTLGQMPKDEFKTSLNNCIRNYPGNCDKVQKTIDNWRTEIDALFCLTLHNDETISPSLRAHELSETQDLVRFFKYFCYFFQYPGGFLKPHMNIAVINMDISFRPAVYIGGLLQHIENLEGRRAGINKAEATHIIFNDLRVTRDNRSYEETWALIEENRVNNLGYNWSGDVIRYAGDILDYMTLANILVDRPNGNFYLNRNEDLAIERFIQHTDNFDCSQYITTSIRAIKKEFDALRYNWERYVNTPIEEGFFDTDIIALVAHDETDYQNLTRAITEFQETPDNTAHQIGDFGENLILHHERKRISNEGRPDLQHLINKIPNAFAVGYDILSREISEIHRYIEVKTTASTNAIQFLRFHMTTNEWSAAETLGTRYMVYRLLVSRDTLRLIIIKDPVQKYRDELLVITPRNGMDITFEIENCAEEAQLLLEREGN
ncbi:protein NO VEIN domain-containing protein [Bacteroidota bacterium]